LILFDTLVSGLKALVMMNVYLLHCVTDGHEHILK